jgi:hypothetical protein
MKSLMLRLSTKRSVGVQIGARAIVASQVAQTPLGSFEIGRVIEPLDGQPLEAVLSRVLAPIAALASWRKTPVAIGLPVLRVFFSTRPIKTMDRDASPQVLLHEVLQSSNLLIDDMDVDMIRSQPFKQPLASIIATRKKYLAPVLGAFEGSVLQPHLVEPAPFALLRAGVAKHRTPRGVKAAVRVFLGECDALSVLTALDRPLAWRYQELPTGSEAAAIASGATTLRTLSRFYGVDTQPELVIVHGRPDLVALQDSPDWLKDPVRTRRHDGPSLDDANVAFGLALGLLQEEESFNLVRKTRPKSSLGSLIPWKQLTIQVSALTAASLLLHANAETLDSQLRVVKKQQKKYEWLRNSAPNVLEKERAELQTAAAAMQHYLQTRVLWTGYARELGELMPKAMILTSFQGQNDYADAKSRVANANRSLTLKLESPITESGSMPPEVDNLIDSIRGSAVLRQDFPTIKLASLKYSSSQQLKRDMASFSVLCTPAPKSTGAKPGGAAKAK